MRNFIVLSLAIIFTLGLMGEVQGFATPSQVVRKTAIYMSDDVTAEAAEEDSTPAPEPVKCPNCDKCDGSGRILGGIPTIPLFSWWPIKPYRPCPNFIANGGQYSRIGQPLDEIAFGRGNLEDEDDDF